MHAFMSTSIERLSAFSALFYLVAVAVLVIILTALFRKDFVKARVWFRSFGFSIEASNSRQTRSGRRQMP
jgi:hypothetical protein